MLEQETDESKEVSDEVPTTDEAKEIKVEVQPVVKEDAPAQKDDDDHLEIPAFLRRQAN